MRKRSKLGLVGAGNIGGTLAALAGMQGLCDVVLVDKAPGLAAGKALDIMQGLAVQGIDGSIIGSESGENLKESDVIVVTAGVARKPGMSRQDLMQTNVRVMASVGEMIRIQAPEAVVIVVTNPLDAMTAVMQRVTGFPCERILGMAGVLDSGRFSALLAQALNVSVQDIKAMVLGSHGDLMVPVLSATSVQGIPAQMLQKKGLLTQEMLQDLVQKTRYGGAEIVSLLKTGSAFYAPAACCLQMVRAILCNENRLLPCSVFLNNVYNTSDIYGGVPVFLGSRGVHSVLELQLSEQESQDLKRSFDQNKVKIQEALAMLSKQ